MSQNQNVKEVLELLKKRLRARSMQRELRDIQYAWLGFDASTVPFLDVDRRGAALTGEFVRNIPQELRSTKFFASIGRIRDSHVPLLCRLTELIPKLLDGVLASGVLASGVLASGRGATAGALALPATRRTALRALLEDCFAMWFRFDVTAPQPRPVSEIFLARAFAHFVTGKCALVQGEVNAVYNARPDGAYFFCLAEVALRIAAHEIARSVRGRNWRSLAATFVVAEAHFARVFCSGESTFLSNYEHGPNPAAAAEIAPVLRDMDLHAERTLPQLVNMHRAHARTFLGRAIEKAYG